MTLYEDIKRHGCPARLALPVFFCFYGGLTLLFGGLAVVNVKVKSDNASSRMKGGWVFVGIGAALIAAAFGHIITAFWILPAFRYGPGGRYRHGALMAEYGDAVMKKSEDTLSSDLASEHHPASSILITDTAHETQHKNGYAIILS